MNNEIIDELSNIKVKRVPGVDLGVRSLGLFLVKPLLEMGNSIEMTHYGELKKYEVPTQVIVLVGEPGSGKTYFDTKLRDLIQRWKDLLIMADPNISVKHKAWEKDGEDLARICDDSSHRIMTPPGRPLGFRELLAADYHLQSSTADAIKYSHMVTIEVPSDYAARVDGNISIPEEFSIKKNNGWLGRMIGSRFVYNLARKRGIFKNLNYHAWFAGLVPGSLLVEMVEHYRSEVKEAKSYKELVMVLSKWNQNPPEPEEMAEFQRAGASPKELELLKRRKNELLITLIENKKLNLPPKYSYLLKYTIGDFQKELSENNELSVTLRGLNLARFFKQDLGLTDENSFVGYNNPGFLELPYMPQEFIIHSLIR